MVFPPSWHPVLAAGLLRASDKVIPVLANAQRLALWRSASGAVQAWEDRCPHRGVALSLGRVEGDRLACAYHGWEYAAMDGRCVAIPAMPRQPVPGKVCVKTYPVRVYQDMVWVELAPPDARTAAVAQAPATYLSMSMAASAAASTDHPQDALGHDAASAQAPPAGVFLRSLCIDVPIARLDRALADAGFQQPCAHVWRGTLDRAAVRLYALAASAQWSTLHLFCMQPPDAAQRVRVLAAARALRTVIETPPEA
ncbi:MAG: Rieske (2Fe-2S) protein [Rhodoferax sp.]|nr:Rieske (2Fe-2S) protein [Rhodoferax sp.]